MIEPAVAIVVAAGSGRRMNAPRGKQYLSLLGVPLLIHTLRIFERAEIISRVVLVVPPEDLDTVVPTLLRTFRVFKVHRLVPGGAERQDSVGNALAELPEGTDWVVVHDGARPCVRESLVRDVLAAARREGAASAGMPVKETLKEVNDCGRVVRTVDRTSLWLTQTPQAFRVDLLREAYARAKRDRFRGTDDAMLVERLGRSVAMIPGGYDNIKVTVPEDLRLAEWLLSFKSGRETPEGFSQQGNG